MRCGRRGATTYGSVSFVDLAGSETLTRMEEAKRRIVMGGTDLRSGDWFTWSRTKPVARLRGRRRRGHARRERLEAQRREAAAVALGDAAVEHAAARRLRRGQRAAQHDVAARPRAGVVARERRGHDCCRSRAGVQRPLSLQRRSDAQGR